MQNDTSVPAAKAKAFTAAIFSPPFTRLACCALLALQACSHQGLPPAAPTKRADATSPASAQAPIGPISSASSTHFAMIGDFGEAGPAEAAVAAQVVSWKPQFIVTLGDNNYPSGSAKTFDKNIAQYYAPFIRFGSEYRGKYAAQGSAEQRFFPALGNHDWYTAGAKPHLQNFALPGNGRYYTVERGPVTFFIVDSDPHEPDGVRPDGVQGTWLKQALAASTSPWKLVVLHHPPFSRGRHGSSPWMQWPFDQWGASAVFSGHDHTFQRLVVNEFPYVVMGLSGASLDPCGAPAKVPRARWSTCYSGSYGALQAWATPQSLTLEAISSNGATIDKWTMTKDKPTGAEPDGPLHSEPRRDSAVTGHVSPS